MKSQQDLLKFLDFVRLFHKVQSAPTSFVLEFDHHRSIHRPLFCYKLAIVLIQPQDHHSCFWPWREIELFLNVRIYFCHGLKLFLKEHTFYAVFQTKCLYFLSVSKWNSPNITGRHIDWSSCKKNTESVKSCNMHKIGTILWL